MYRFAFPRNLAESARANSVRNALAFLSNLTRLLKLHSIYVEPAVYQLRRWAKIAFVAAGLSSKKLSLNERLSLYMLLRNEAEQVFLAASVSDRIILEYTLAELLGISQQWWSDNLQIISGSEIDSPKYHFLLNTNFLPESANTPLAYHRQRWSTFTNENTIRLSFSPLTQISIGHMMYYISAVTAARLQPTVFNSQIRSLLSSYGYGTSLLHRLVSCEPYSMQIFHYDNFSENPLELSSFAECDSINSYISANLHQKIEQSLATCPALIPPTAFLGISTYETVVHLRTASFKQDSNPQNDLRDSNYLDACNYVRALSVHTNPIVVTADPSFAAFLNAEKVNCHLVGCSKTEREQWELMAQARYIVGCASGISHLEGLFRARSLYLNVHSLLTEFPVKSTTLFSTRKIRLKTSPTAATLSASLEQVVYAIIYGFDRAASYFLEYFDVTPLSVHEMLNETLGFFQPSSSSTFTLHQLMNEMSIEYMGPNRNLTERSYRDILTACSDIIC